MFHILESQERANRAALLLAHDRFVNEFKPFIANGLFATRMSYAKRDILAMIDEVCEEVNADFDYVAKEFLEVIADHMKIDPNGLPNVKNVDSVDDEHIHHTDVMDRGDVDGAGLEEALDIPQQDLYQSESRVKAYSASEAGSLKDQETWKPCFRCGNKLNPIAAQASPVCYACTTELNKSAVSWNQTDEQNAGQPDVAQPLDENAQFQCTICAKNGQAFTGVRQAVLEHVESSHQNELQQQNQQQQQAPSQQLPGQTTWSAVREAEREEVDVAPGESTPADRFDDLIQQIANRAAAMQFSQPDEEEIRSIAEQYGLDEGDVRQNLFIVSNFGDFMGANGQLTEEDVPDGYTEVQNLGGRVESHEALVPVNVAIAKVAEEMNMKSDLVYNMVRDRYGADLPDKYHASVSGEHHFYLPEGMIGEQNEVGPSANPDIAAEEAQTV